MCDLSAYNYGRAGGWPHLVNRPWSSSEGVMNTLQYYDVVNFARFLKIPGIFSWGFNDHVCPPSSMFAAYNQIKSEKTLYTVPDTQHFRYPEQQAIIDEWILKKLKIQNNLKSGVL
jgi:cephalosporin-C deacetylase-like acetyl esterase